MNASIDTLEGQMRLLENDERKATIRSQYLNRMRRYVRDLSVERLYENQYRRIDCSIQESGSDLPRGLLAYCYAILQTIAENEHATYMPIVMDSPRQQDQDGENWLAMLRFLRDEQPKGSQLTLSLRENTGVEFLGGVITYEDKFHVLRSNDYEAVFEEIMPFVELSLITDDQNGQQSLF